MAIKHLEELALIADYERVKVTKMNHLIEIQHMEKVNTKARIKKLNKDEYLEIETGEIREFEHSENRSENKNSLRQTFKKLRYLINNNFTGAGNELHVTFTYEENMTDTKRLYKDFNRFMTRFKRKYKNTSIDYISVIEPQDRGAWHCHVLMRFNDLDKIYIPNKFDENKKPVDAPLYDMWGQGYVTIKSLKDVDNIGAYLSAYLADIELTENNVVDAFEHGSEIVEKEVEGIKKRFIKGGRLHMYPSGMNLFRKSKGIVYPERVDMSYKNAKKIVGSAKPHYQKSYKIESEDYENTITYIQFNTKRMSED